MQSFNHHRSILIITLVTVAIYLWLRMDQGWIPHDEGLLGQSAERVVLGEIPHIDFDDPYTGGQAMLHALSFKLFGIRSYSIRMVLFAFSIIFALATYSLASRFAKPWLAALLTLTSVSWSVPNYFAGLPSWYNLFFAMFGTWALVKYDETARNRWLVLAGAMGGVSFLFKLSGLFFVAAGLLFLVFREQEMAPKVGIDRSRRASFLVFCFASLVVFVAMLLVLIRQRLTPMDILIFVVPSASLAAFLVVNEWNAGDGSSWVRFKGLLLPIAWFTAGAVIPVMAFLVPYLLNSGLSDFVNGVFILPQQRLQWTDYRLPPIRSLLASIPLAVLMVVPFLTHVRFESQLVTIIASLACIIGVLSGSNETVYTFLWNTARPTIPMATILGSWILFAKQTGEESSTIGKRCLLFLFLSMASMVSLIQFPYSFGIYFCYAAPFAILALAMAIHAQSNSPRGIQLCVLCLYLGFAVVWLNHGKIQRIGVQFVPQDNSTLMSLSRSGLWVSESQADLYKRVIAEVTSHSQEGDYIYATSDCPEIYFLSGRRNPTRTFYDFFEPDFQSSTGQRISRISALLKQFEVDVVVLHWQGEFSGTLSHEFAGSIAEQFPNVRHFVRNPSTATNDEPVFSVAWRDPVASPAGK